ncbi:MAG: dihydrofolate reductase family protein [Gemmatimonadales bacterium]
MPATPDAPTRLVRHAVAMSLDGYIAGPGGEYDWIVMDPTIDFAAIMARYDTYLIGRKTFAAGGAAMLGGSSVAVFSRTLRAEDHPGLRIVADDVAGAVADLRARPGKDLWLFGGGELFRSFLELGLVDEVEVAVVPVLLGGGIPLLPAPARRTTLELKASRTYPSGIVSLEYRVVRPAEGPPSGRKHARTGSLKRR